jgi:F-type H+-transporting ATPase subunit b
MTSDCRHSQKLPSRARAAAFAGLLLAATCVVAVPAAAAVQHGAGAAAEAGGEPEAPHEQTLLQTAAKLANFAILAGVLVYFLKGPIGVHLASRAANIRQDLAAAAEMRAAASAQLAEIDRKLKTLPAELDALKARGAEDVAAEQARIAQAAAVERDRLIAQTRREIEMRLRVARRELTAHAAQLAVNVAEVRIRQAITLDDQLRLVDRYTAQLKEAR